MSEDTDREKLIRLEGRADLLEERLRVARDDIDVQGDRLHRYKNILQAKVLEYENAKHHRRGVFMALGVLWTMAVALVGFLLSYLSRRH
jgi:hypothetical protein